MPACLYILILLTGCPTSDGPPSPTELCANLRGASLEDCTHLGSGCITVHCMDRAGAAQCGPESADETLASPAVLRDEGAACAEVGVWESYDCPSGIRVVACIDPAH